MNNEGTAVASSDQDDYPVSITIKCYLSPRWPALMSNGPTHSYPVASTECIIYILVCQRRQAAWIPHSIPASRWAQSCSIQHTSWSLSQRTNERLQSQFWKVGIIDVAHVSWQNWARKLMHHTKHFILEKKPKKSHFNVLSCASSFMGMSIVDLVHLSTTGRVSPITDLLNQFSIGE